ncbi:MAG: YceI family protein [Verrucomicrobia bacterium]|nr:YceI family protein [Verrucomicrobiota bacterium]
MRLLTRFILVAAALALSLVGSAHAEAIIYKASPAGSTVKIDGTSTIHNWTVEGKIIGGQFEADPGFPMNGTPDAGKASTKAKASIPIRSLKSGKTKMDEVMQEHMKAKDHPRIDFETTEMSVKVAPASAKDAIVFDAKGKLTISGVTKETAMIVTCDRSDATKLKFKGETTLKMTDFGIQPPAPSLALGLIKTGDEVKITIEWVTAQARTEAAAK